MRKVPVWHHDKVIGYAKVDNKHYHRVMKYTWYINTNGWYIWARVEGVVTYLHHFIIGKPPVGYEVDHIDRSKANNCEDNLQFITHAENLAKRKRGKQHRVDVWQW